MRCSACDGEIDGAPVLVPKNPRGSVKFCAKRACLASATRRAALIWPAMRGLRGRPNPSSA